MSKFSDKMLNLRNILCTDFRSLEKRNIIRHVHSCYFESKNEIMENVLGRFITIGINLPDTKNILTETALKNLNESIKNFDCNDEIDTAVLHGIGGNFCFGMVQTADAIQLGQNLLKTLHMVKKPIIAAMEGYTVDFGLYLAAMCDMRIVDKSSETGVKDQTDKFGIPPFLYERLILTVGLSNTFELLNARHTWKASHCLTKGFANKAADLGCCLGVAMNFAQSIAFNSPLGNTIDKKFRLLSFLKHKGSVN